MGLVDGLGFEEVNQSGLSTNLVQTVSGVHTRTSSTNYVGTDVNVTGSLVGGRINDGNGALFSASTGSPASYGVKVQAGKVATTAGSTVTIKFGTQFANTNWKAVVTAGSVNGAAGAYISGARNVSGALLIGAASTTYDYVAVGL